MEFEQILQLIDHVSDAGLSSFTYEAEGVKLSMKGGSRTACAPDGAVWTRGDAVGGSREQNAETPSAAGIGRVETAASRMSVSPDDKIVTSPLVGTFYVAPAEDAEPFVRVGDTVKAGQVLAIVEAMKLMNEIESDYDGVVTKVLARDGEPVEYGQPLFCIE